MLWTGDSAGQRTHQVRRGIVRRAAGWRAFVTRHGLLGPSALLLAGATACDSLDSFRPVTREGAAITNLFRFVLVLSALVLLIVIVPLIYAIVRFRGRPGEPDPPQVAGNRTIEIIWTGGAFALVVILFVGAVLTMQTVSAAAPSALRVTVIGHQWWWEYQYPDLGITTANELHLPTGQSSQLDICQPDSRASSSSRPRRQATTSRGRGTAV